MKSSSTLVNATRQKNALTDNGAVTNSTSLNSVVDLFFIAGASRTMSEADIKSMLSKSWAEDALSTLKVIFWASDVREGQGERRFFRIALSWLEEKHKKTLEKNLKLVPEFSRWDSLFHLKTDKILGIIYDALKKDKNGLCAKWMPRKQQYDNFARRFQSAYELSPKQYRKLIVKLSETVEQQMCSKEWSKIVYKSVPSVAFNKYRNAFKRNDPTRFEKFIEKVEKGEETINAGAIFPYDIYNSYHNRSGDARSIDAQWSQLPDYMADTKERILPMCDVSGSMTGLPMAISVSLGVYLSERNKSIFKDAFVTFSGYPTMQYLKGTVTERFDQLQRAEWDMNTDLSAAFKFILKRAVEEKVSQKEMPTTLLIISDMEFDECADLTNYENLVNQYSEAGYKLPNVVFWNVNGRAGNVPVDASKKGVALVSGASPSIVKSVLGGKNFTPLDIMKETINKERYSVVKI